MTLGNIIDRRSNSYDIRCDAIFEDSWHDNSVAGATQFDQAGPSLVYDELAGTSVAEAIVRASSYASTVTVFLYDVGSNSAGYSGEDAERRQSVLQLRNQIREAVKQADKEAPLDRDRMRDAVRAVLAEGGAP